MKFQSFKRCLKQTSGFTLVELMVVVAIIGILSAVAIPNFKQYQAKSKTSEAKLSLAAIYTAETSFYSDADTYATCLADMGYSNLGQYYATGFGKEFTNPPGIDPNGVTCRAYLRDETAASVSAFAAQKVVGGATVAAANLPANDATAGGNASTDTWTAGACGVLDANFKTVGGCGTAAAGNPSYWTIDQNKTVSEVYKGY